MHLSLIKRKLLKNAFSIQLYLSDGIYFPIFPSILPVKSENMVLKAFVYLVKLLVLSLLTL